MFERFTTEARRAVILSREEAAGLHRAYVDSEHILLGLLGEPGGLACRVLGGFGLSLQHVREEAAAATGPGDAEPGTPVRFSPRAKKTLELAAREALALRHDYIGTEHILLGVIRGDGAGAEIVNRHADLAAARRAVLDLMPAGTEDTRTLAWQRVHQVNKGDSTAAGQVLRVTPAADTTLTEAARLAGSQPAGSHHLVLAALADPGTAAARALTALGIDLDRARQALSSADATGTSDERPENAGRRQIASRMSNDLDAIEAVDLPSEESTRDALLQAIAERVGPPPTRHNPP